MARTFPLGKICITSAARKAMARNGQDVAEFLTRHMRCDWGEDANDDDRRANDLALEHGAPVLSAFRLRNGDILWVNTDGGRYSTFVWLPREEEEE